MDSDHHRNTYLTLSSGASKGHMNEVHHDDLNMLIPTVSLTDNADDDILNDETFGDCDLESIKKKSDFGPNGEFLGEHATGNLPDFFDDDRAEIPNFPLKHHEEQSQQPSIDALLGEDSMRFSTSSIHRRATPHVHPSPVNPLFSMNVSQNTDNHRPYPYLQQSNNARISPMTLPSQAPLSAPLPPPLPPPPPQPPAQQQINYQLLKQFEQLLINKQVPPQERLIYIKAMMEKMQRDAIHAQQQQQQQMHFQQQQGSRVNKSSMPMRTA